MIKNETPYVITVRLRCIICQGYGPIQAIDPFQGCIENVACPRCGSSEMALDLTYMVKDTILLTLTEKETIIDAKSL